MCSGRDSGIGKGWRSSAVLWCSTFTCWHIGHFTTNRAISLFLSCHQNHCFRSRYIFVPTGCIEYVELWASNNTLVESLPSARKSCYWNGMFHLHGFACPSSVQLPLALWIPITWDLHPDLLDLLQQGRLNLHSHQLSRCFSPLYYHQVLLPYLLEQFFLISDLHRHTCSRLPAQSIWYHIDSLRVIL